MSIAEPTIIRRDLLHTQASKCNSIRLATAQKLVKAGDKTICKKIRDGRGCGGFRTNKNANNITVPPKYTYTLFAYAKG
jgi:hypothetical protein